MVSFSCCGALRDIRLFPSRSWCDLQAVFGNLLTGEPAVFAVDLEAAAGEGVLRVGDLDVPLAGVVVGYPLGCAAGTTIAGSINRQDGSFLLGYLCALGGLPIGYGIGAAGIAIGRGNPIVNVSSIALGILTPPVCSTIGYNLARNPSPGLGRLDQRLQMPSIGLKREPAGGETAVALDVRLLNVRF